MAYSLLHALNISRQDMLNRLLALDVTSNNLANVNTAGYKASRANFQELLSLQNRDGELLKDTQLLTRQGPVSTTSRPLDWAVEGEGFFQVRLPDGTTGYTRDGQFQQDANGDLVTASGFPLIWDGEIPDGTVELSLQPNGMLQALTATGERVEAGQIALATFANPSGLLGRGDNVFAVSEQSGEAVVNPPGVGNSGWVMVGAYEQSNVNMAEEMTTMMTLQRAFQMSVRAFQQSDAMIGQAIQMRKG